MIIGPILQIGNWDTEPKGQELNLRSTLKPGKTLVFTTDFDYCKQSWDGCFNSIEWWDLCTYSFLPAGECQDSGECWDRGWSAYPADISACLLGSSCPCMILHPGMEPGCHPHLVPYSHNVLFSPRHLWEWWHQCHQIWDGKGPQLFPKGMLWAWAKCLLGFCAPFLRLS